MMNKCPLCGEIITELIWWENSKSELDLEGMTTDGVIDTQWEFDCPECDCDITHCDWVQEISNKLYGENE